MSGDEPPPKLRFTEADSALANVEWKASCGPHSLAAAFGLTLAETRRRIAEAGIEYKGWMNPTHISRTILALRRSCDLKSNLKTMELCEGINRIQWEGKWLNPGVPARLAYFHTHYVAHIGGWVLCTACEPARWITAEEWRRFHLTVEPISLFHITHHWKIA